MANIVIFVTSNSTQTGVTITDQTDWSNVSGSLASLTDITISLYGASLLTPDKTYTLSPLEESTYTSTGTVELLFSDIYGSTYINDGWWTISMSATSGGYISNYSGFGIYSDITFAVYNKVNNLHVPEEVKYDAERYCMYVMWLEGLKFLDTTNVNSRGTKFTKRLLSLQKMLLPY